MMSNVTVFSVKIRVLSFFLINPNTSCVRINCLTLHYSFMEPIDKSRFCELSPAELDISALID